MENIKVLISEAEIEKRVKELADEIYKIYQSEEVIFVTTLKGACPFAMKLATSYKGDARFEFVRVSSYQGSDTTGILALKYPLNEEAIKNKNIIIIEDIVDTGYTLEYLKKYIESMNAKSIIEISLLSKKSRRKIDIEPTFVGFEIEDLFVVGFGLDYDEKYRNLPFIGYIENESI